MNTAVTMTAFDTSVTVVTNDSAVTTTKIIVTKITTDSVPTTNSGMMMMTGSTVRLIQFFLSATKFALSDQLQVLYM